MFPRPSISRSKHLPVFASSTSSDSHSFPQWTACVMSQRSSYWSVVSVAEGTSRLGRFSNHQRCWMLSRTLEKCQDLSKSEQYSGGNRFSACFWTYWQTDCISERTLTSWHLFEGTRLRSTHGCDILAEVHSSCLLKPSFGWIPVIRSASTYEFPALFWFYKCKDIKKHSCTRIQLC